MRSLTRAINRLLGLGRPKFRGSHPGQFLNHHRRHLGTFSGRTASRLASHFFGGLVNAQAEECRMAKSPLGRPFEESDLRHQLAGCDPVWERIAIGC